MPTQKPRFEYRGGERTAESVVRRSKQSSGAYDNYLNPDVSFFKPKEGENVVRIMPPTWPREDMEKWGDGWEITIWLHREVGPEKDTYLCLDKMLGDPCPICAARMASTDSDERDMLKPNKRNLAWIIDRNNTSAGPMVWGIPVTLFREINARSVDKKTNAALQIDNHIEGYDLIFNREGSGLRTKFSGVEFDRDPTPLSTKDAVMDRWLDDIMDKPLPTLLQYYPPEHIEKVLFGQGPPRRRNDDEADDRRSSRGREEPLRSRKSEPAEVDEVDDRAGRRARLARQEGDEDRSRSRSEPEPAPAETAPPSRRRMANPPPDDDDNPLPDPKTEDVSPTGSAKSALERLKSRQRT